MQALITRPAEDARPLAAAVAARGIVPILEPLLRIRQLSDAPPDLGGVQALVFTSANGARAFAAASPRRELPVFAVGGQTAATARFLGFSDVASAGGDVGDLAALVAARLTASHGALLHVAGSVVAGDLAGRLGSAGFSLRRAVLYAAEPATSLSPATTSSLQAGTIELALFFSPRTAASFVTLLRVAALDAASRGVSAFCLSPAVAAALAPLDWRQLVVADAPNQPELLAALDRFLAARSAAAAEDEG